MLKLKATKQESFVGFKRSHNAFNFQAQQWLKATTNSVVPG
jgi:hypothetical protein